MRFSITQVVFTTAGGVLTMHKSFVQPVKITMTNAGRPRAIPARLIPELLQRRDRGEGYRLLSRWLKRCGIDAKARSWLAGYLVGEPGSRGELLHTIAVEVAAGSDPLELDAAKRRSDDTHSQLMHQSW